MKLNVGDEIRISKSSEYVGRVVSVYNYTCTVSWKHPLCAVSTRSYSINQIGDGIQSGSYFYRARMVLPKEERINNKCNQLRERFNKRMAKKGKPCLT